MMSLLLAIALYFICWWIVLFTMLPIGVRSQHEDGEVTPGTDEGAPVTPHLLRKVVATTVISGVLFGLIYAAFAYRLIGLDDVPFLPRFEGLSGPIK